MKPCRTDADTSIVLPRGKDAVVRGFHNVCSRHGNSVVTESGDETFGSSKGVMLDDNVRAAMHLAID